MRLGLDSHSCLPFAAGRALPNAPTTSRRCARRTPKSRRRFGSSTAASVGLVGFALLALVGAGRLVGCCDPSHRSSLPPEVQARERLGVAAQAAGGRRGAEPDFANRAALFRRCAFDLPPGELTTTEFCRAIAANDQIGPELATAISDFCGDCDERKFAPRRPPPATGAADARSEAG